MNSIAIISPIICNHLSCSGASRTVIIMANKNRNPAALLPSVFLEKSLEEHEVANGNVSRMVLVNVIPKADSMLF